MTINLFDNNREWKIEMITSYWKISKIIFSYLQGLVSCRYAGTFRPFRFSIFVSRDVNNRASSYSFLRWRNRLSFIISVTFSVSVLIIIIAFFFPSESSAILNFFFLRISVCCFFYGDLKNELKFSKWRTHTHHFKRIFFVLLNFCRKISNFGFVKILFVCCIR